jgi:surfactin family lipopeptide synthetase C
VREIESGLKPHPSVSDSVVVATGDAHGDNRLIAYVATAREQAPTTEELRNYIKGRLPEYMSPATFVFLQAIPLTPSGKVDRRRLPIPDVSQMEPRKPYVAPRTPIEEEMASIWEELLKQKHVGIYDNFFEQGGHSLLLTQLASRIRKVFGIEIPLRVIFDAPTIVEITKAIVERQASLHSGQRLEEMVNQLRRLSPQEIRRMLDYNKPKNSVH